MQQELLLINMTPQNDEDVVELQNVVNEKPHKFDDESQRSSMETNEFEHDHKLQDHQPKSITAETTNDDDDADAAEEETSPAASLMAEESFLGGYDENEASSMVENGRERLKRHRVEVAGGVWIPDIWGQEELLKDWIDCTAFDSSLMNNAIMSARAALVEEGRRANSTRLRIENSY